MMNNFQLSNPYMMNQSQCQCQTLIRVNGIDGAKAYQMGINSTAALFDANEDIMYIKQTDGAGFPSIRLFKFEEIKQDLNNVKQDFVTREELEEYVKQFIQQSEKPTKQTKSTSGTSKQAEE